MTTVEEPAVRECPFFCGKAFSKNEWYQLALHIEEDHTEDSPFVAREAGAPSEGEEGNVEHSGPSTTSSKEVDNESTDSEEEKDECVLCPEEGCGEVVLLIEYADHLDLHQAENAILDDSASCNSTTNTTTYSTSNGETSLASHGPDKFTTASPQHFPDASSSSVSSQLLSAQSHTENFSTAISPALRDTNTKSKPGTSNKKRHTLRRPFTKFASRTASQPSSSTKRDAGGLTKGDNIKRLGVSTQ